MWARDVLHLALRGRVRPVRRALDDRESVRKREKGVRRNIVLKSKREKSVRKGVRKA